MNYKFEIKDDIAIGTLGNGEQFIIDADMVDEVSKHCFYKNSKGYLKTMIDKKYVRLHWLVLGFTEKPKDIIDHINRNKLDCRRANLRLVTNQQNAMNRNIGKNNHSGFLGAFYSKGHKKYIAKISINKKQIIVYKSNDLIECAQAYNYASQLLFRNFSGYKNEVPEATNFIKDEVKRICDSYKIESLKATESVAFFNA